MSGSAASSNNGPRVDTSGDLKFNGTMNQLSGQDKFSKENNNKLLSVKKSEKQDQLTHQKLKRKISISREGIKTSKHDDVKIFSIK